MFSLDETASQKAYNQVQCSKKNCFGNCNPISSAISTKVPNEVSPYVHNWLGLFLVLKTLMPFALKSSSKSVAEQKMLFTWEALDRFMVRGALLAI